jgi:hypothetical protein
VIHDLEKGREPDEPSSRGTEKSAFACEASTDPKALSRRSGIYGPDLGPAFCKERKSDSYLDEDPRRKNEE